MENNHYLVDDNNNNMVSATINGKPDSSTQVAAVMVSSASNSSSSIGGGSSNSSSSATSSNSSSNNNNSTAPTSYLHNPIKREKAAALLAAEAGTPGMVLVAMAQGNGQATPKPRGRRKKVRTEPIRPICPQCEKQFSNQSALTKHKLTHSDERKFACQQCSKAFKRHDHLTGHMQTHSNRKPFNCNIQGCDKTYCDARSLRRHKENIHHIVTPKENNNNHHQQPVQLGSTTTSTTTNNDNNNNSSTVVQQQPSHLLTRRIQRLHSEGAVYAGDDTTLDGLIRRPMDPNQQQHNSYPYHQASFSADYASTQHFSFDFNQMTDMDQQVSSNTTTTTTIPHSADSVATDAGINSIQHQQVTHNQQHHAYQQQDQHQQHQQHHNHNGYLTPTTLHPPTPQSAPFASTQSVVQFTANDQQQQQQQHHHHQQQPNHQPIVVLGSSFSTINNDNTLSTIQQPSHLLTRRIQRLHSTGGCSDRTEYATTEDQAGNRLDGLIRRPMDPNPHQQHHLQHHHHLHQHHSQHYQHHQASFSADYASTQHFSFDFNQMTNMDQQVSSNTTTTTTIPHSADSVATDAGINSIQHQQVTPNQQHHAYQQQDQHQQHQQHRNHNGYLTPTTLHPPTPQSAPFASTQSIVQFTANDQQQQQQQHHHHHQQQQNNTLSTIQQPSHLLTRRIQRLHSTGGCSDRTEYATTDDQAGNRLDGLIRRPMDPNPHQQQQQQHHLQHHQHHLHQHQNQHYQNHQASFSADYASTQHFSFDFNHMDQPLNSSNTIPHSADSITDSGLGLNMQYEQQMTPSD